jgi:hypothetical protein
MPRSYLTTSGRLSRHLSKEDLEMNDKEPSDPIGYIILYLILIIIAILFFGKDKMIMP